MTANPGIEETRRFAVTGRIHPPLRTSAALADYRVQAWEEERLLTETTTDGLGRFLLEWDAAPGQHAAVTFLALAPWKTPAGEVRLAYAELLSPHALAFHAVTEPGAPPRPIETLRADQVSEVVSERDLSVLLAAVDATVECGRLRSDEATWVQGTIADFDRLFAIAREAVLGDLRSLDILRTRLSTEGQWNMPLRAQDSLNGRRAPSGDLQRCFVAPRDPLPLIWAPVMLDGLGGEFPWSERALAYFNARALPVNVVLGAAHDWAAGRIGPADFAGIVRSYDPVRFGRPGGGSPQALPDPGACLSERNVCIGAFLFDLQQYGSQNVSDPPAVGSVVPDAVCAGSAGLVSLLPPSGTQFPATAPSEWSLAVDGKSIAIQSWSSVEVVIELPADITPGCQPIRWVHGLDPEFVHHLGEIGAQCAPYFGGARAWTNFPLVIGQTAILISVVGSPHIQRFTADGLGSPVVEGCVDVKLEWEVDVALCASSGAYLDISLLKDGNLLAAALAPKGEFTVNDDATATYTLRAEAYDGAIRCSFVERDVQVQRYHALRCSIPPGDCIDAGATLPVNVMISCPAPAGGLTVILASSHPGRLAGGSVNIPEGSVEAFIELAVGFECGGATITASASAHQASSFERLVSNYPQITAVTPPQVNACAPVQVWIDGACFGDRVGQQSAFLTDISGSAVAGKILQLQAGTRLLVEFPALVPGQYRLSVASCGKIGSAGSALVVNEMPVSIPMFSATPGEILLCPVFITLSWRVDAARRVRILRDGVPLPGSERTRNQDCGPWEETFDDPQLQANTVQYKLEAFPTSGSPVKTAQTTVAAATRKTFLSLAQQGSSAIYNNLAPDPLALCQVKHAVVTLVKNMSGRDLSLAHGGAGAAFVLIASGGATHAFDGALVEGNWSAQVGGATASLPLQVTFAIDWKVP